MKKLRVVLAAALALMMCIGSVSAVFADAGDPAAETDEAAITKVLKVPFGTDLPALMDFVFKVEALSVDDEPLDVGDAPVIGNAVGVSDPTVGTVPIQFTGGSTAPFDETLEGTVAGVSTWYLESDEIFGSAVFGTVNWPHAGVYEYEITEIESDSYQAQTAPPYPDEALTYSKAVYNVKVYVSRNATTGLLEITHIGVLMTVEDDGDPIPDTAQEKVDPTPGGGSAGGNSWDYSQLIFTNSYVKTNEGGIEDPSDWLLSVSKEVDGDFSDTDVYFDFDMTVTEPSLIPATPVNTYKAYVLEEDPSNPGEYIAVTLQYTGPAPGNYTGTVNLDGSIDVTTGTTFSFRLKHGQFLVFTDLPVGTAYEVIEYGKTGYAPEVTVVYNGGTGHNDSGAAIGDTYYLPGTGTAGSGEYFSTLTDPLFVGESLSSAAFLNNSGLITPTGLNLNDLPFIGLIIVAIGALVAFVAVKSRKSRSYN